MNPLASMQTSMKEFTKKEKLIADYILQDPQRTIQLSAEELATLASSSKSAYIRMCQKMGFEGYRDFRFSMSRYLVSTSSKENEENPMQEILSTYSEYILNIAQTIQKKDVHDLAQRMMKAKRIKIFGNNRTGLSAKQLRMRLTKIGIDAEAVTDSVIMRDLVEVLDEDDLCIIFSIKAMPSFYNFLSDMRCQSILLTMTPKSPLHKEVDKVLTFPYISRSTAESFLDDQAIFFVFIEVLLNELSRL